jgi:hypothetical protein
MQLTFGDDEGMCYVITTARGIPVSGIFEDWNEAHVVLAFLTACEIEDEDLDAPRFAGHPMEVNGVLIGFRTELAKKIVWLTAQPAWKLIVDALELTLDDITIYRHPDVGETLAIKRHSKSGLE